MSAVETIKGPKGPERNPFTLLISGRFEEECAAKVPCVVYYAGKKDTKKGQQCHDLKFVKADDKDVFRKEDEDLFDVSDDSDDEVISVRKVGKLGKEVESKCPLCTPEGMECIGQCEFCECHLPLNGSQCRCKVKTMFNF